MTGSETCLLSLCSLIGVTCARRRLTWSSTSLSTSPHTPPLTSPALCAIRGSPASPASNLISCCMRRRRWVGRTVKQSNNQTVVLLSVSIKNVFFSVFCVLSLLCDNHCRIWSVQSVGMSLFFRASSLCTWRSIERSCQASRSTPARPATRSSRRRHTSRNTQRLTSRWGQAGIQTLLHFTESDRKLQESNSY